MPKEYEELHNKLNDFKEREKDLQNRLKNHRPRQNQSDSDGSGSAAIAKKSQSYQQILNSPIPKTSPPQILQQPLQSPSSNLIHNLEQNGTNTSNLNANVNPSVESTDENSSELIGNFNKLAVVVFHQLLDYYCRKVLKSPTVKIYQILCYLK